MKRKVLAGADTPAPMAHYCQGILAGDTVYAAGQIARDDTVWMAWQFDRPESGEGVVQVFRRPRSPYESARFTLRGLDAGARYAVMDIDILDARQEFTGAELAEPGLRVVMPDPPAARVLTYRKLN